MINNFNNENNNENKQQKQTWLHFGCDQCDYQLVEYLVEKQNANVNTLDSPPTNQVSAFYALKHNDTQIINYLASHGCNFVNLI